MVCFQSLLIVQLESSSFLPLLLTLASSALLKDFNPFNVLVLDILQLLFQPVSAVELAKDQKSAPREGLESLLAQENLVKQSSSRNAASRHSRFGTAISIRQGGYTSGQKVVLNRSNAIQGDAGSLLDQRKKKGRAGGKGARKAVRSASSDVIDGASGDD
jgi:replication fork protection complex subunit Tof1/Swi1